MFSLSNSPFLIKPKLSCRLPKTFFSPQEPHRQAFLCRKESICSWLVDRSGPSQPIWLPHRRSVFKCALHAHASLSASQDNIIGISHETFYLFILVFFWLGLTPSANMTIRTARPDRGQHFRSRMHCLKKVGGHQHHQSLLVTQFLFLSVDFVWFIHLHQSLLLHVVCIWDLHMICLPPAEQHPVKDHP